MLHTNKSWKLLILIIYAVLQTHFGITVYKKKKKKNPNAVCLELAVECLGAFYNHKKLQRYSLGRVYER